MNESAIGILIFDGVEVMDFAGPFEVFSVARRDPARRREAASPLPPRLIGLNSGPVTATGGMRVEVDATLESPGPMRALVVPGGSGIRALLEDSSFHERLRALRDELDCLLSVCTGALLLGRAGLLDGLEATTHHRFIGELEAIAPACRARAGARVVDTGRVITAGGIASGIDAALHLLARFEGREVAEEAAAWMEYTPQQGH